MKNSTQLIFLFIFLTFAATGQVNKESARSQFTSAILLKGIAATDIESINLTADHVSSVSGIHHFYYIQAFEGIGIYNAVGSAHFDAHGSLIQTHSAFEGKIGMRINTTRPKLTAKEAILMASKQLNYVFKGDLELIESPKNVDQKSIYRNRTLSLEDIPARLMYQVTEEGVIKLAWDISILETSEQHWWSIRVDAVTGKIIHKNDWMVSCNFDHAHDHSTESHTSTVQETNAPQRTKAAVAGGYNVYAMPLQSPADGNRTLEVDPHDLTASPFGWHDTTACAGAEFTITRGNNAHAYDDGDNPGFSPDGTASLMFDFPIDTVYSAGTQSEPAVITNLFYWNNIIHDLWYHYGFTEAAGNFQENNYGNGGAASDYVLAEAQDGSGTCNANFGTPSDGSNPRMQMYVCNNRDGDLDNLVIVHEYGHGISNRLTGGPSNAGCLGNGEQMGEGWSDYLGLMMTLQSGDQGTDPSSVGTWLTGESINGDGIRPHPYSTDMTINPHTYADIEFVSQPHGVGSVWCMMLWEMTWALIDQEGFDPDFFSGTSGNNIAMTLVMEGMKLQPCSPGFVDGRDAILLADQQIYGGQYECLIVEAFAKRGLGPNADQGSSSSVTDGSESFDLQTISIIKSVDKVLVQPGDTLSYTIKINIPLAACNSHFTNILIQDTLPPFTSYLAGSASNGGSAFSGIVTFPAIDTLYPGDSIQRTFSVIVDTNYTLLADFEDGMESGAANWTVSTTGSDNWAINGVNPYAGSNAWFAADISSTVDQFLELDMTLMSASTNILSFWHSFDTEATWDGGIVQYSTDSGSTWKDLGPFMIQNGYNSTIDQNKPGFSGNSNGYLQTKIDLSNFIGQDLKVRFWMSCDPFVGGDGWYIDEVKIEKNFILNTVHATANGGVSIRASQPTPTEIENLQCTNGIQDGDETGIDCGGTFCPPCPTCSDGLLNGDETGIDCGGPDCDPCPTCEDGIQNGDEEGVDCGGPDCDPCPCLENEITLSITLDNYPEETSWEIRDSSGTVLEQGGTYATIPDGTTISFEFCLSNDCYEFFIFDTFGDGICCSQGNGSYTLYTNVDSTVLASGGNFTFVDSTEFCLNSAPTLCDSLLALHGIIAAGIYHANDVLYADGIIQTPDTVLFKSGSEINLQPDFEVELGAELSTSIEACVNALKLIEHNNKIGNNKKLSSEKPKK